MSDNFNVIKMNKWKVFAILFTFISIGAIKESYRIIVTPESELGSEKSFAIPMAVILTSVIIFFTIRFWKKASGNKICC